MIYTLTYKSAIIERAISLVTDYNINLKNVKKHITQRLSNVCEHKTRHGRYRIPLKFTHSQTRGHIMAKFVSHESSGITIQNMDV